MFGRKESTATRAARTFRHVGSYVGDQSHRGMSAVRNCASRLGSQFSTGVDYTRDHVSTHPLQAVGIALGLGLLLGYLLRGSGSED